jgi:hypothetical protein
LATLTPAISLKLNYTVKMAGKEAIIFIVDANHTMNVPYCLPSNVSKPSKDSPSTRLSAVKEAVLQKITSMAWQSKEHEFGIVILKTEHTHHHLYSTNTTNISKFFSDKPLAKLEEDDNNIPFPNQIELDLTRPSRHMLNTVHSIRPTPDTVQTPEADFCQSLILAADTLYRRTSGKKYRRTIILFTDAEHEVEVDGERLECVLNGLKKMDVELEVVGLGFQEEGVFVKEEDVMEEFNDEMMDENDGGSSENEVVDLCDDDDEDRKMPHQETHDAVTTDEFQDLRILIKRENEKLLISLTQQTGGRILAANGEDITSLLEKYRKDSNASGTKTTRNKCLFRITPDLTIEARYCKMIAPKAIPSLKKDAYILDETTGEPMVDGAGEYMTTPIDSIIYHTLPVNPDNPEEGMIEVPQESRTDAYRFGSDLIPIGKMDMAGINAAFKSPNKTVEMIGYIPSKEVIQSGLTLGPAYALIGGKESKRSMAAVAALAEAMEDKGLWGYCRFVKSINGDPSIAVLVPQKGESKVQSSSKDEVSIGWYFALLQLPFGDEINVLKPPEVPSDHWGNTKESKACDDLIDSLMLEDDELDAKTTSFPALYAYQRMITHFAMNPITDDKERKEGLSDERILQAARPVPLCELDTVKMLSKKASQQVDLFFNTFPLSKSADDGKKPEKKYWGDGN